MWMEMNLSTACANSERAIPTFSFTQSNFPDEMELWMESGTLCESVIFQWEFSLIYIILWKAPPGRIPKRDSVNSSVNSIFSCSMDLYRSSMDNPFEPFTDYTQSLPWTLAINPFSRAFYPTSIVICGLYFSAMISN